MSKCRWLETWGQHSLDITCFKSEVVRLDIVSCCYSRSISIWDDLELKICTCKQRFNCKPKWTSQLSRILQSDCWSNWTKLTLQRISVFTNSPISTWHAQSCRTVAPFLIFKSGHSVLLSNITDGADTNGGACTRVVQTFKRNVVPHIKLIIMECVVTKRTTSDSIATNNLGHRYETWQNES